MYLIFEVKFELFFLQPLLGGHLQPFRRCDHLIHVWLYITSLFIYSTDFDNNATWWV